MNLIVVVDKNWGIGHEGDQPYHILEDQRFFWAKTKDRAIVVGRKTLAAFPGGRPLKNRVNIVLTRDAGFEAANCVICRSLEELADKLRDYSREDIFVAGGQQIYEMLLDYCDYAYVTKIFAEPVVDRFFPNLDTLGNWELVKQGEIKSFEGLKFCFCEYRNLSVRAF